MWCFSFSFLSNNRGIDPLVGIIPKDRNRCVHSTCLWCLADRTVTVHHGTTWYDCSVVRPFVMTAMAETIWDDVVCLLLYVCAVLLIIIYISSFVGSRKRNYVVRANFQTFMIIIVSLKYNIRLKKKKASTVLTKYR